jgi:hypothetical protein
MPTFNTPSSSSMVAPEAESPAGAADAAAELEPELEPELLGVLEPHPARRLVTRAATVINTRYFFTLFIVFPPEEKLKNEGAAYDTFVIYKFSINA